MRKFNLMTMMLLMLALLVAGPLFAQDINTVPCADLAEADCAILTQSTLVNNSLSSSTSTFNVDLVVANIPDMPFGDLNFNLRGDVNFNADPALLAQLTSFQNMQDPQAVVAYFQDPAFFADIVSGFNGEVNLTVTLPEVLLSLLGAGPNELPTEYNVVLRLVDGVGYINLDNIAAAIPQAGVPGGWIGLDLARAVEIAIEQGAFDEAMQESIAAQPEIDADAYDEIMNHISIQRLADSTIDGKNVAVFETVIDYVGLFGSDFMQETLAAEGEFSEADLAEGKEILNAIADGVELVSTQYIGLDDYYIYRTEVLFNFDMTNMLETVGETVPSGDAPTIKFTVDVESSNFNSAPAIVAPDGAQMYPVEALFSNS